MSSSLLGVQHVEGEARLLAVAGHELVGDPVELAMDLAPVA